MLIKLIVRILTNAIAIYIASQIVPGFTFSGENNFTALLTAGFILGLINFFIKPVLKLISFPLILLTFGLFTIVLNIAMLFLLAEFVPGLTINGWGAAFWAMIVISAVNFFIEAFSKK